MVTICTTYNGLVILNGSMLVGACTLGPLTVLAHVQVLKKGNRQSVVQRTLFDRTGIRTTLLEFIFLGPVRILAITAVHIRAGFAEQACFVVGRPFRSVLELGEKGEGICARLCGLPERLDREWCRVVRVIFLKSYEHNFGDNEKRCLTSRRRDSMMASFSRIWAMKYSRLLLNEPMLARWGGKGM
jgi:hypothetical protein